MASNMLLAQPATAFYQGRADADASRRQNALMDIGNRRMAMDEAEFGARQQAGEQQAALKRALAAAQWAKTMPKAGIQQNMPDAVAFYEQANGPGSWQAATDQQVQQFAGMVEARLASELGMGPPEGQGGVNVQTEEGPFGTKILSGGGRFQVVEPPKAAPTVQPSWKLVDLPQPDGSTQRVWIDERAGPGGPQVPFGAPTRKGGDPAAATTNKITDAENVVSAIDDAESRTGFFTTGFIGQVMGNLGGTDAYGLRRAIDTIKANVGFDRLQRMREESKTGGALGQVAVQELTMLQATIASLDPNQKEEDLRRSLRRVRAQYTKAINAYEAAMNQGKPASDGWSIEPVE